MKSMYSQCMSVVENYLLYNGFVNHRIARVLLFNIINQDIMKRTRLETPKRWANTCIRKLVSRCKSKNPKYRRANGNEQPGIYLIDMPGGTNDGDAQGST